MCVMGVACDINGDSWMFTGAEYIPLSVGWYQGYARTGLEYAEISDLIRRNNSGESFASLADYLESLLPRDAIPASVRAIFDVETEAA